MNQRLKPEDDDSIFDMLEGGKTKAQIAATLNVSKRTIERRVVDRDYLAYALSRRVNVGRSVEEIVIAERKEEQRGIVKTLPTRMEMLGQLAAWATIDPSLTKYDTSSQKAAHDELWKRLGYQGVALEGDEAKPSGPDVYQPAWMREPVTQ